MTFVVKMQLSIGGNINPPRALVYNEDRSVLAYMDITPLIETAMNGRVKAFFYANVLDGVLSLDREAPWQSW